MPNILDEYLIKLGSTVDTAGMARFNTALREAASFVDSQSTRMAGSFLKAQTEIVGGFAAIGGAALGLVDKVAMADQEYRLFALHMFMSKDAARGLKVAMDALGQPLENLAWDPELRGRTSQLLKDQRAMAPEGDFDAQMLKIRNIRFEFTRMEVELQYLAFHVVQDFMKALGMGPDDLLKKLHQFNDWVTHNLPQISSKLVSEFLPVWRDVQAVGEAVAGTFKDLSVAFTNVIGLLTGNTAIMGTAFSMDKLAIALQSVVHGFASFAEAISQVEDLIAHLISALALMSAGKFSGAGKELSAAIADISFKSVLGVAGGVGGAFAGGPLGVIGGAGLGSIMGGKLDDILGHHGAGAAESITFQALLAAVQQQESGGNQNAISSKGAIGLMQLMPSTARGLGVNPYNAADNVRGGTAYLHQLLSRYHGNVAEALGAYNAGPGRMDSFLAGKATLPGETQNYISRVLGRAGQTGDVHIGSVTIHIAKNDADSHQLKSALSSFSTVNNKRVQRNLSELTDPAWGY